jgi:hypothetical protein
MTPSNMRTRKRLADYDTIEDAVDLLKDSDSVVVLAGAGISTSVGIPDFRSAKGTPTRCLSSLIPYTDRKVRSL